MNKMKSLNLIVLLMFLFVVSCNQHGKTNVSNKTDIVVNDTLPTTILTAEQRAKLTPNDVLELLKKGNKDFAEDNLTVLNTTQRVRDASIGQYPMAAVLACMDSRVPVEDIFHVGIGDVFVARVAGNIVNEDMLGSLEYACKVSGAKVIVILGHEYCGAIKSAIDDVKLGNITSVLAKIQPAVKEASLNFEGEKTSSNPTFVEKVCDDNVYNAMAEIRSKSPILKELEDKGEIIILGGVYDIKTGEVDFFDINS